MTGYITHYTGRKYKLPALLSWSVNYASGDPCDAFEVSFAYDRQMADVLSGVCRFTGEYDGETVFFGVVDEYTVTADQNGCAVRLCGRSLGALLLDNEAEAAEYAGCSVEDILDRYVRPLGISRIDCDNINTLYGYAVASGTSCMKALSSFTDCAAGITPRFSKDGTLVISARKGDRKKLTDESGVSEVRINDRRYGAVSDVLVKNRVTGTAVTVEDRDFIKIGGRARRVINVPGDTGYNRMHYTGEYRIRESNKDRRSCTVTLSQLFAAFPGDIISLQLKAVGLEGEFEVREAYVWADGRDSGTKLKLMM